MEDIRTKLLRSSKAVILHLLDHGRDPSIILEATGVIQGIEEALKPKKASLCMHSGPLPHYPQECNENYNRAPSLPKSEDLEETLAELRESPEKIRHYMFTIDPQGLILDAKKIEDITAGSYDCSGLQAALKQLLTPKEEPKAKGTIQDHADKFTVREYNVLMRFYTGSQYSPGARQKLAELPVERLLDMDLATLLGYPGVGSKIAAGIQDKVREITGKELPLMPS